MHSIKKAAQTALEGLHPAETDVLKGKGIWENSLCRHNDLNVRVQFLSSLFFFLLLIIFNVSIFKCKSFVWTRDLSSILDVKLCYTSTDTRTEWFTVTLKSAHKLIDKVSFRIDTISLTQKV